MIADIHCTGSFVWTVWTQKHRVIYMILKIRMIENKMKKFIIVSINLVCGHLLPECGEAELETKVHQVFTIMTKATMALRTHTKTLCYMGMNPQSTISIRHEIGLLTQRT